MLFREIYGNDELKPALAGMVRSDRLGHALLFHGSDGGGALAFALALAQYVNCTGERGDDSCGVCPSCNKYKKLIHLDLHFAFPVNSSPLIGEAEKKKPISDYFIEHWRKLVLENPYFLENDLNDALGIENKAGIISVNEAKQIISKLSLKPYEGRYKTLIIYLPEKMNAEAANKLLKLLEEPPTGTLFLLVSKEPGRLLPTILSRCQLITLKPMQNEDLSQVLAETQGLNPEDALNIARLSGGSYGKALNLIHGEEENSELSELLHSLFDAAIARSLADTISAWEAVAELGREKQKQFCLYCEDFLRKCCMCYKGMEEISFARSGELEYIRHLSKVINPSFYSKGLVMFDNALRCLESNVNPKLVFCDLGNRILSTIR